MLTDTIELRAARIRAYNAGLYCFNPPPVYCGGWDTEAWCNHVKFNNPELTGFLPYDRVRQGMARVFAAG